MSSSEQLNKGIFKGNIKDENRSIEIKIIKIKIIITQYNNKELI